MTTPDAGGAAVLFIVFARPDQTRRVWDAIRGERPPRLYVAADGARPDRPDEAARVAAVRSIVADVDWPCEVRTLFRDRNLGCRRAVAGAIDWFFEHEAEGIVIEDDVLPTPGLFAYFAALLSRYREDDRIAMISGCTLVEGEVDGDGDYYLSRYMNIWGWATWRRAWQRFDLSMTDVDAAEEQRWIARAVGGRRLPLLYWRGLFDRVRRGDFDTWDYQWLRSAWRHDMLSVQPRRNMVLNLGYGDGATHARGGIPRRVRDLRLNAAPALPRAPRRRTSDPALERVIEAGVFGLTWRAVAARALRNVARAAWRRVVPR